MTRWGWSCLNCQQSTSDCYCDEGPELAFADIEDDPEDEIMRAAGIGKQPTPKNWKAIERAIDFDEAQKASRAKMADRMAPMDPDAKPPKGEAQIQRQSDPRMSDDPAFVIKDVPFTNYTTLSGSIGNVGTVTLQKIVDAWNSGSLSILDSSFDVSFDFKVAPGDFDFILPPNFQLPATNMREALDRKNKAAAKKAVERNRKGWRDTP